jgi:hypothetical protein
MRARAKGANTMNALINIGLCRNTEGFVKVHDICAAFDGFAVCDHKHRVVIDPVGEDTYVCHVSNWDTDKAYAIAKALDQDCIAQYDLEECQGALIGPNAKEWGAFDPQGFKLL